MWQSRKEYTPGLLIKAAVGIRDDGMLNASVLLIYRSGTRLFGCSMIEQPSVRLCACIWINAESRDMSTYFSRCGACSAHVRTARACAVMSSARRTRLYFVCHRALTCFRACAWRCRCFRHAHRQARSALPVLQRYVRTCDQTWRRDVGGCDHASRRRRGTGQSTPSARVCAHPPCHVSDPDSDAAFLRAEFSLEARDTNLQAQ